MLLPEISRPMPIFYLFLCSLVDLLRGAIGVRERGIERVRRQSLRSFVESHRIIASRAAASSTKKKTASPLARATPPPSPRQKVLVNDGTKNETLFLCLRHVNIVVVVSGRKWAAGRERGGGVGGATPYPIRDGRRTNAVKGLEGFWGNDKSTHLERGLTLSWSVVRGRVTVKKSKAKKVCEMVKGARPFFSMSIICTSTVLVHLPRFFEPL